MDYTKMQIQIQILNIFIDEAKFGSSQLGKTKDGRQMSNDWLNGAKTKKVEYLKLLMEIRNWQIRLKERWKEIRKSTITSR